MASAPYIDIAFGPLIADISGAPSDQFRGYLVNAEGLRPSVTGYRPMALFGNVASASAVPGTSFGRLYATNVNGTLNVFSCSSSFGPTNTRIHQSATTGASWSDIEGASGAPGLWADFCEFDNLLICGSRARAPQQKDLFAAASTALADLAGSPPTGATIARVRDHVVIGNLTTDNISRSAVRWGAIGDPEDWPTPGTSDAASKEAGIQYLPRHLGQVTKVMGGEKFGLIFQERGITRMTYVGGAAVYEFDTFERKVGTGATFNDGADSVLIPHPVIDTGDGFYWANPTARGIYTTDGYGVKRVSAGKIDSLVLAQHNSAVYDPYTETMVFVALVQNGLIYNRLTDQFGFLVDGSVVSTMCDMAGTAGDINSLNAFSISSSGNLQQQNSATEQTVELQTGYIEIDRGFIVQFQGAELLGLEMPRQLVIEAKAASNLEDTDDSALGFTTLTAAPRGERFTGRLSGRYLAFRVTGTANNTSQILSGLRVHFRRTAPAP